MICRCCGNLIIRESPLPNLCLVCLDWLADDEPEAPDQTCPKCGCQVFDPFTGKQQIHSVAQCPKLHLVTHDPRAIHRTIPQRIGGNYRAQLSK